MDEEIKQALVETNINNSVNHHGLAMNVRRKAFRFPPLDGIQQKITLKSNKTGTWLNVGFIAGVENTLSGNIADELLDVYPDIFSLIKVNGRLVKDGVAEKNRADIKSSIMEELREEYELKPKTKETKRQRVDETKISKGLPPISEDRKNTFSEGKEEVKEETKLEEKDTKE